MSRSSRPSAADERAGRAGTCRASSLPFSRACRGRGDQFLVVRGASVRQLEVRAPLSFPVSQPLPSVADGDPCPSPGLSPRFRCQVARLQLPVGSCARSSGMRSESRRGSPPRRRRALVESLAPALTPSYARSLAADPRLVSSGPRSSRGAALAQRTVARTASALKDGQAARRAAPARQCCRWMRARHLAFDRRLAQGDDQADRLRRADEGRDGRRGDEARCAGARTRLSGRGQRRDVATKAGSAAPTLCARDRTRARRTSREQRGGARWGDGVVDLQALRAPDRPAAPAYSNSANQASSQATSSSSTKMRPAARNSRAMSTRPDVCLSSAVSKQMQP